MNIATQVIGGIYCKVYQPKVASNFWLIWLHGLGELGAPDGSQIDKVELYDSTGKIPISYTALARIGFEFPFNIIAPQLPNTQYSDFWKLTNGPTGSEGWFVNYVKETFKATKVVVTGYSLGGRGTWNLLRWDSKNYIDAIAPVAGYYDASAGAVANLRSVPGFSVHGDHDTTMVYAWDLANIQAYNATPGRPTQKISGVTQPCHYLDTIVGATHSVWPLAYDTTSGKDFYYQWILAQFEPAVIPVPVIDTVTSNYSDGTNLVFLTASGKKYSFPLQS